MSPLSVRHSIHGIHFEWHAVKAVANRRKHGVEFEQACEVFFDPFLRTLDADQEGEEAREAVLGLTEDWQFLYVVFVERGDAFRIVSARRATRAERRHYED
ncbi:MAG: BrnT family toxin [Thermoanaerobaculia bacterium]